MIPFFRKIRYRLAKDNQFLKYSRYAIGEIVLVVIGILIALQINNWNEWRKERIVERTFLVNLKEDLDRNKKLIKEDIARYELLVNTIDLVLNAYNNQVSYNDTLNRYFHLSRVFPNPQLSLAAYEEIKTKGMDLIQSEQLRKNIGDLYEIHFSEMTQNINRLEKSLRPVQLENQVKLFYVKKGELVPIDGDKLMRNDEYFNIISQRKMYYIFFKELCEKSLEELVVVQNMIEKQLSSSD